ncbi:MAG: hypothetical protein AB7G44_05625 [Bacteroidia bacterium]
MKTFIVSCLLSLASVSIVAQDLTLDDVRKKYPLATKNDSVCKELYTALTGKADGTDVLSGYAGGVTMLMAKSTANPFSKMEYFKDGKKLLEDAISNNKNDIELRFLRFAIQDNLPSMLGYNENLEEDKSYIMKYLPMLDKRELRKAIANYLIKSEKTDDKEKASLKKYQN